MDTKFYGEEELQDPMATDTRLAEHAWAVSQDEGQLALAQLNAVMEAQGKSHLEASVHIAERVLDS